ncbi:MAG: hypothetical protein HOQ24_08030 [Mycobacteriaceae bacterium]|nr:hypothetical protein [Mycobacteriaceae bacterium]
MGTTFEYEDGALDAATSRYQRMARDMWTALEPLPGLAASVGEAAKLGRASEGLENLVLTLHGEGKGLADTVAKLSEMLKSVQGDLHDVEWATRNDVTEGLSLPAIPHVEAPQPPGSDSATGKIFLGF